MATNNHYTTLGVKRNATQAEIKKAYRRLAKKYHPDVSNETNAESQFKKVAEAYDTLKNKEKRTRYDLFGSNSHSPTSTNSGFSGFDPSIFGDFFKQAPPQKKPSKQTLDIVIAWEDSLKETSKEVKLTDTKKLTITIPKGIKNGETVRFAGKANNGGDLLVKIKVTPQKPPQKEIPTTKKKKTQKEPAKMQDELELLVSELGEINDTLRSDANIEKTPTKKASKPIEYRFESLVNELEHETSRLAKSNEKKEKKIAKDLRKLTQKIKKSIQALS